MHKEQLKLADLSNVKVGDTIWTIQEGDVDVIGIRLSDIYSIKTKIYSYAINGKNQKLDKHPSAFIKNPFENVGFQERWMMVSMHGGDWRKRKVFAKKNGIFLAWYNAKTDEAVKKELRLDSWKYAKEIEEPKELELTLEQIAEKFGVSVESIKIKK
jgi:hypothetical protein